MTTPAIPKIIIEGLKSLMVVTAALTVLFGAGAWLFRPHFYAFVDDLLAPLSEQVSTEIATLGTAIKELQVEMETLQNRVGEGPRPVVEFRAGGRVVGAGPFYAGSTVPILYTLRRTDPCSTAVRVQFFSAERRSLITNLTYEIPSTQAAPSFGFIPFVVDVRLPSDMRPGWYSYAAIMIPDKRECPLARQITVPMSDFFYVEERE